MNGDKRLIESIARDIAINEMMQKALMFLCGFICGCVFAVGVLIYLT